jgi:hypothetical protein
MIHYTCDLCGRVLADDGTRYEVRIEVYAACDPMEISPEDLAADPADAIRDLLDEMAAMDADELQDGVYRSFRYDLCPECHAAYLKDPLVRSARQRARFGAN